ncbi:MAG TPA: tryptophan--tRNA ligase [Candidatus Eremiobacteraceae bacterium]|nr:tryptophan--tRNA ligase [Candidatus Eremiobacteraceae bacterium]
MTDASSAAKPSATARKRIMAGMRPTGTLHVGHLLGALRNFVDLSQRHDCYFEVADLHALTTKFERSGEIAADTRTMVMGWIAAGLDPANCTIYVQSRIPEISELYTLLSMVVPVSWLERVPTYKDQIGALGSEIATHGFLGYPVLQTVDIAIMKGQGVPVGQDQLPHLELSREIVRRFNHHYGAVLIEPEAILSETPYVPGTDGRKMSKSYDNGLMLAETAEQTVARVKTMYTDPTKVHKTDPGHPETCPVFFFQSAFNPSMAPDIARRCRAGEIGCVEDKADMARHLNAALAPLRERLREIEAKPQYVDEVLSDGTKKARATAQATLAQVKAAMGLPA